MPDNVLHIENLKLRLPATDATEARNLGEQIVHHISENLPDSFESRRIENLNLKVKVSPGISSSEMTVLITKAILEGLL